MKVSGWQAFGQINTSSKTGEFVVTHLSQSFWHSHMKWVTLSVIKYVES